MEFANQYKTITSQEKSVIYNTTKSILVNKEEIWIKHNNNNLFDITMGSKHGAEICELVGLYILQELKQIIPKQIVGIYRDDGIIAMNKSISTVEVEKMKKELHKFAKSIEIKINKIIISNI